MNPAGHSVERRPLESAEIIVCRQNNNLLELLAVGVAVARGVACIFEVLSSDMPTDMSTV